MPSNIAAINVRTNGEQTVQTLGRIEKSFDRVNRAIDRSTRSTQRMGTTFNRLLLGGGALSSLYLLRSAFEGIARAGGEWEQALVGVQKTTGLTDRAVQRLGKTLSRVAITIGSTRLELAGIAQVAGQLGVQADDIEGFTVAISRLASATDLAADDAATFAARYSNLTGRSLADVQELADQLANLGNNIAAQESEIAGAALTLAQRLSSFGLNADFITALGASVAEAGLRFESAGTALNKFVRGLQDAGRFGGTALRAIAEVLEVSVTRARELIETDIEGTMTRLLQALSEFSSGDQSAFFGAALGITDQRGQFPLATLVRTEGQRQSLSRNQELVADAEGASTREAIAARSTALGDLGRIGEQLGQSFGELAKEVLRLVNGPLQALATGITSLADGITAFLSRLDNLISNLIFILPGALVLYRALIAGGGVALRALRAGVDIVDDYGGGSRRRGRRGGGGGGGPGGAAMPSPRVTLRQRVTELIDDVFDDLKGALDGLALSGAISAGIGYALDLLFGDIVEEAELELDLRREQHSAEVRDLFHQRARLNRELEAQLSGLGDALIERGSHSPGSLYFRLADEDAQEFLTRIRELREELRLLDADINVTRAGGVSGTQFEAIGSGGVGTGRFNDRRTLETLRRLANQEADDLRTRAALIRGGGSDTEFQQLDLARQERDIRREIAELQDIVGPKRTFDERQQLRLAKARLEVVLAEQAAIRQTEKERQRAADREAEGVLRRREGALIRSLTDAGRDNIAARNQAVQDAFIAVGNNVSRQLQGELEQLDEIREEMERRQAERLRASDRLEEEMARRRVARARELQATMAEIGADIDDKVGGPLRALFRGESFTEALGNALLRLRDQMIDLLIIEPIMNLIRQQIQQTAAVMQAANGAQSGGGGFFANLITNIITAALGGGSPAPINNQFSNIGSGGGANSRPAPRASGGPVRAGSPYLVGERGPELFIPNHNGMIQPNNAMMGSNTVVINNNQTINARYPDDIREVIREEQPEITRSVENTLIKAARNGGTPFAQAIA